MSPITCKTSSKHCYTHAQGKQMLEKRQPHVDVPLYLYKCPECTYWHLTRQSQPTPDDFA